MTTYKAIVTNKETKERLVIESEYSNKSDFIRDLRANGYMVNGKKVKTAVEFDRIMDSTDCDPWEW